MHQSSEVELSTHEKRRILSIIENSSLGSLTSTFLVTMGCACTVISCGDLETTLDREVFDAVLLDSELSVANMENAVLKIKDSRPSLSSRILVIRSALTDPMAIELIERHNLYQVAHENLLQQLWTALQDLLASSQMLRHRSQSMQIAQMTFDSYRNPCHVNLRSSRAHFRHVAYQHRSATVDLLIEPREDSGRISITGQLLYSPKRKAETDGLPVLLVSAMRTMTRTSTNQHGEFRLECTPVRDVCVELRLRQGAWVSLPLGKLEWANGRISD